MTAAQKMHEFGLKRLAEATGYDLATIYRWAQRIKRGRGITDDKKRAIIAATAASPHAVNWADFYQASDARAA